MDNVKLASELLLLAKSMVAERMDKVWENKNIRINHDGYHNMIVQELPAKGKKRLRNISIDTRGYDTNNNSAFANDSLVDNVLDRLSLSPSSDFDDVKTKLAKIVVEWKTKYPEVHSARLNEGDKHFLEVEPADAKPFSVKGKDFEITVSWTNFEVYSPNSDFQQADPHYTYYDASAPQSGRKLYKMLLEDPKALSNVSWAGLSDFFNKNKIRYDSHHSVWH